MPQSQNAQETSSQRLHAAGARVPSVKSNRENNSLMMGDRRIRYRLDKMDCATEERLIRARLETMPGIGRIEVNLMAREVTVHHDMEDVRPIAAALSALDMDPITLEDAVLPPALMGVLSTKLVAQLTLGGLAAVGAEVVAWMTGHDNTWSVLMLAAISILSAGLPTLKKGLLALRSFTLNINFLMSVAVIGALAIGKWPEAAMVIFLFALAETIEALSLERARNAIRALTTLVPETAEVRIVDGWQKRPVGEVAVGQRIRIRPGERVPLDAQVESGQAALDQAPITGESLPVDKQVGDALYAGSIVTDGVIEATVTATASESTLARVAATIQEAQSQRAPTQRFVDQFARYYTPLIVVLAALVATLGPVILGGGWDTWFYQALVLLVIACPCALVVSTPVTVVSGLAAAAKHGMLIKGGAYLETGRLLKVVALDKTGTLTEGKPTLTDALAIAGIPISQALTMAASLDEPSTHPVAQALVRGWRVREPGQTIIPVEQFGVLLGRGVRGNIAGETWYLGNHRLVEELGVCSPELESQLDVLEKAGKTTMVLFQISGPAAAFAVADEIKSQSIAAVKALRTLGIEPVMLTGDNPATASAIAGRLGIQDARGNLMPQDKHEIILELRKSRGSVGMVGDGVNDAPALASADIGFAMGAAGTATALETADVAIMDDDPRKIADFIALSRKTSTILKQNIAIALGLKGIFLVLALTGHATLWMAVFADMGASLLVVLNGLRLLRIFRKEVR